MYIYIYIYNVIGTDVELKVDGMKKAWREEGKGRRRARSYMEGKRRFCEAHRGRLDERMNGWGRRAGADFERLARLRRLRKREKRLGGKESGWTTERLG